MTQLELSRWADNLRDAGYPYIGHAGINYWRLESDGRIRSIWKYAEDTEFVEDEDDVIQTIEEIEESVRAWVYDY